MDNNFDLLFKTLHESVTQKTLILICYSKHWEDEGNFWVDVKVIGAPRDNIIA